MTRELGVRHEGGLITLEFLGTVCPDNGEGLEASVDIVLPTSINLSRTWC